MESKLYTGSTSGGIDGYAGLRIGTRYTGTAQPDGTVRIELPTGRPTSISAEQWAQWFSK